MANSGTGEESATGANFTHLRVLNYKKDELAYRTREHWHHLVGFLRQLDMLRRQPA
jgi:hypothetical protein